MAMIIRQKIQLFTVLTLFVLLISSCTNDMTQPTNEKSHLNVGDVAPSFQANDQNGHLWNSDDHLGSGYMVVYFYPAAMTGGCTKQACGFRDNKQALEEYDVDVVGISGDAVANLKIFERAFNLNFTLLSDVGGTISSAFGVPAGEGGSIDREVEGDEVTLSRALTTSRWTFILDNEGTIVFVDTEVDAEHDSQHVIDFLKSRQA